MDIIDHMNIKDALCALAALINQASRPEATSADAVKVSKVPTALLLKAQKALARFRDSR